MLTTMYWWVPYCPIAEHAGKIGGRRTKGEQLCPVTFGRLETNFSRRSSKWPRPDVHRARSVFFGTCGGDKSPSVQTHQSAALAFKPLPTRASSSRCHFFPPPRWNFIFIPRSFSGLLFYFSDDERTSLGGGTGVRMCNGSNFRNTSEALIAHELVIYEPLARSGGAAAVVWCALLMGGVEGQRCSLLVQMQNPLGHQDLWIIIKEHEWLWYFLHGMLSDGTG